MKSISIFIFLSISCCIGFACQPILRIYETDQNDEINLDIFVAVDEPDLPLNKGIQNNGTYTCPVGVWMAYRNENFGGAEGERFILTGKEGGLFQCSFQGDGGRDHRVIRSVKVIGSPEDYSASAVVIYTEINNHGFDFAFMNDTVPQIPIPFHSFILMGHQAVELFTEEDFRGDSHCVSPNNGDINGKTDYVTKNFSWEGTDMYTNVKDISKIFGNTQIRSFKLVSGCSRM